jgi:hypothetical protein
MSESASDRPAFEITPAMIEAGKRALIAWHEGVQDFDEGARSVFLAMRAAHEGDEVKPEAPQ